MGCNHNNINCGCKDNYLTTPPPCPSPTACPDPQPCSEVFDADCILYTGDPVECNDEIVISTNTAVSTALANTVAYVCELAASIPLTVVAAGAGISVTPATVGTTTTYTVASTGLARYTSTIVMDTILVIPIAHNLNTTSISVTLIDDVSNVPLIYGTHYTVTVVDANTANISRTDAGGSTRILIIG